MTWTLLAVITIWTLAGLLSVKAAARASGKADPRAASLVFFLWPLIVGVASAILVAWGFLWLTGQVLLFLVNERRSE